MNKQPTKTNKRIDLLDIYRGFAILGIFVVNIVIIEIYNLSGQSMHTVVSTEKNTKIATKDILAAGIYIIKITDANTNSYYKKIVIQ